MKKQDLRTGMKVQYRNGNIRLVDDEYLRDEKLDYVNALDSYKDDLIHEDAIKRELDIMKVYDWQHNLIWERKELPKITEDTRILLSLIESKYKYIAKDSDNRLYAYTNKPVKNQEYEMWEEDKGINAGEHIHISGFNKYFNFIKWEDEEPYCIKDLLED